MNRWFFLAAAIVAAVVLTRVANATLIGFPVCTGANACVITTTPPNPVSQPQ